MVQLIKRCPEYMMGYKAYCQELYDNHVTYFRPTNPKNIDDEWFFQTKSAIWIATISLMISKTHVILF